MSFELNFRTKEASSEGAMDGNATGSRGIPRRSVSEFCDASSIRRGVGAGAGVGASSFRLIHAIG